MNHYFKIDSVVKVQNKQNIRKDGLITCPIRIYIFGASVFKFYKEIGFEGAKQESLKALIYM
jgi:hypothetical protein